MTLSKTLRWSSGLLAVLLPTLVSAVGKSAADYFVRDLPGLPEDATPIKMHAGHIEVEPEHNGALFFWHFQNRHIANKQRTVLWLNGGPGCSSEDGALMEVGPYRVDKDQNLQVNNGSWHEFANLLFVDNPVGTGFSFVDTNSFDHELTDMANHMVTFLTEFFKIFPEYEDDELYIAGESYAGQHIPYIAQAILDHKSDAGTKWNLAGLLIGNGWVSPAEQYDAYVKFSVDKGLFKKDDSVGKVVQQDLDACHQAMDRNPGHISYMECENILRKIMELTMKDNKCYNMYDVRLKDSYPACGMNWPSDLENVTPYLRRTDVTSALNIDPRKTSGWEECVGAVGSAFSAKKSKPAVHLLPGLLQQIPILLFSGADDLICNYMGTEDIINSLEWSGAKGFETSPGNWAPRRDWTFEDEAAGFWQESRNLTYVQFYNASHMVPYDWPRRSRDMLDRFMGVDIKSIGGIPTDSRIDGDKMPETSVEGAANNTKANQEETQKKLDEAKWEAYQKSGEVVLVIVIVAVAAWGCFLWRERRKHAAYRALSGNDSGSRLNLAGRRRGARPGDLEASAFDEAELDDMHIESPAATGEAKHTIGPDDSEDEAGPSRIGEKAS